MATIWIWNSIASRRRSVSDTFVENGLGVLAGAVERDGHRVRVIDWARNDFYRSLTPAILARAERRLVLALMDMGRGRRGWLFKMLGLLNLFLQRVMSLFQRRRMAAALRDLAEEVAESGIRIFGIKVWYGEAFTWSKYLANEIRKVAPEVLLVAGGYHATLYEEDFLKYSPFDLAVISEGEAALTKILDVISASPVRREEKSFTEDNPAPEIRSGSRCRAGEGNKGAAQRGALRAELRFLRSLLLKILPANKSVSSGNKVGLASGSSVDREALLGRIHDAIASGSLTNVVYRNGDEIKKTGKTAGNINAKTVSFYGDMSGKVRLHVLMESTGCPWGKCHFCVHHHFEPQYMQRKVERIVDEIRAMREQGIGLFRFGGSDTTPELGAAIARGILDSGMRVEYAMNSRARQNARDPVVFAGLVEKYSLMIRSGLSAVFMGAETGHDAINDQVMNKGVNRDDLICTIRALRAAERATDRHVDVTLAMIYPTPLTGDVTDADVMAANVSLIAGMRPDAVWVNPPGPFKNSEWFRQRAKFGFDFEDSLIPQAMEYEYVLYKPLELWPDVDYRLDGRGFKDLLRACGEMRSRVEALGVPTDLSVEDFLMMRACGYAGADGARAFKRETLADIVSCDYRRLEAMCDRVNEYSLQFAGMAGQREEATVSRPAWVNAGHPVRSGLRVQPV